jgi:hypothetical protein
MRERGEESVTRRRPEAVIWPGDDESCESVPVSASYRHVPAIPNTSEPASLDDPSGAGSEAEAGGADALGAVVARDAGGTALGRAPDGLGVASEHEAAAARKQSRIPIVFTWRILMLRVTDDV